MKINRQILFFLLLVLFAGIAKGQMLPEYDFQAERPAVVENQRIEQAIQTRTFDNLMSEFWEMQNTQLMENDAQLFQLGDDIWMRMSGEKEFYLGPTVTDVEGYFQRIRALDSRDEALPRSKFYFTRVMLNEVSRQMLALMDVRVPEYYLMEYVNVLLPMIDIDELQIRGGVVEILQNYGKNPIAFTRTDEQDRAVIWSEGFEGSMAPYTIGIATGSTDARWKDVNCQAYAGTWALWCAGAGAAGLPYCTSYANSMNTFVFKTTGVSVGSFTNHNFSFRYKYQTELDWDFLYRLFSSTGTSWTIGSTWSGNSTAWPSYSLFSIGFTGFETYYWRFEYFSDPLYVMGQGAYLDELIITGDAGCNSTALYPSNTLTPNDNWQYVNGMYGGEYSLYSVTSGQTYQWSLCPEHCGNAPYDSELTLRRASDNSIIAFDDNTCGNDARISWTATFTGNVKLVLTKAGCTNQNTLTRVGYKRGALVAPTLAISPVNRPVTAYAGSTTFAVTSNTSWVLSGWPSWITSVTPASGSGYATVTVNYAANSGSQRIGTISGSHACGSPINATVTQGADPGCNSSVQFPSTTLVPEANWKYVNCIYGGEYSLFSVISGQLYQWSICPEHCGDAPYDSELTLRNNADNTILAFADDVCGDDARISWTATFTGTVKLVVSKFHCNTEGTCTRVGYKTGALVLPTLALTPSNQSVLHTAGTTTFTLASNTSWQLTGWPAWMSVTPSSGIGNATITVNYQANTGALRVGTISVIHACETNVSVTVTQGAEPGCNSTVQYPTGVTLVPILTWKYEDCFYPGEFGMFAVTSGQQYQWSLCPEHCGSADYDSQLTLRRASDNSFIAYSDDVCGDDARLSWTATFTGNVKLVITKFNCASESICTKLAYKLGPLELPALSVSPFAHLVNSAAGSVQYNIISNTTWVISGWPAWVSSVNPISGTGNAVVTINYSANATASPRTATLSAAKSCGAPVTFTLVQGEPTLTCPQYNFALEATTSWQTHISSHGPLANKIYRIPVVAGRQYVFKTGCGDGATADYDTFMELLNSECGLMTWNDDGCENSRSKIEWVADYSGFAYLKVRGFGALYGTYTLAYRQFLPQLTIIPTIWNFGNVVEGTTSPAKSFVLTNTGPFTVSGDVLIFTGTNFSITSGGGAFTLAPGAAKTINVVFQPSVAAPYGDFLDVIVGSSLIAYSTLNGTGTPSGPGTYSVTFNIQGQGGTAINNAIVTLNTVTNPAGNYIFPSMAPGTYNYSITHACHATKTGQVTVVSSNVTVPVTMNNVPGDADGNGVVNVSDIIFIVDYYIGTPPATFCFNNADVNSDGVINVQDVVGTVNIFMGGKVNLWNDLVSEDAYMYLGPSGIDLESDGTLAGLQFELSGNQLQDLKLTLELPDHLLVYVASENKIRAMVFSISNNPIPQGRIPLVSFSHDPSGIAWDGALGANLDAAAVGVVTLGESTSTTDIASQMDFKAYPNPAREMLWVEFINNNNDPVTISLLNMHAQLVSSQTVIEKGKIMLQFNINELNPGVYFIRMDYNDGFFFKKIIVN